MKLFPSLLAADHLNLGETVKSLESFCDGFHIDVMDDHFVPNIGFGPAFINSVRELSRKALTVHLMVENPENWVERVKLAPSDRFVFHWEATGEGRAEMLVQKVRSKGWDVGVALNPSTSVQEIEFLLLKLDLVVLMGVEPGFSGQKFIDSVAYKISELVSLKKKSDLSFPIYVDGGVNKSNLASLIRQSADYFSVGSAVFGQPDYAEALQMLYAEDGRCIG